MDVMELNMDVALIMLLLEMMLMDQTVVVKINHSDVAHRTIKPSENHTMITVVKLLNMDVVIKMDSPLEMILKEPIVVLVQ